ncbi:MAG: hypothetical protein MJE12_15165, partial [Alphaproteobacteria bacterium]|nr:hypothetical protein [Alphaproteobacteria bacterium]
MSAFRERRFTSQDGLSLYYRDYGDPMYPGGRQEIMDIAEIGGRLIASRVRVVVRSAAAAIVRADHA